MDIIVLDIKGTPHRISEQMTSSFAAFARHSGERYSVLSSAEGDLFNTCDINDNIHKRDSERGGMFWKLRNCNKECFTQYGIFLRSKNRTPYILAQRNFRNDIR